MEELKGSINIEITRKDNEQTQDVNIEGSMGLCMYGVALAIVEMENSLPEEKRALFRTDFLATVNDVRKESTNANT